jgi:hypothetical protein
MVHSSPLLKANRESKGKMVVSSLILVVDRRLLTEAVSPIDTELVN